MLMHKIVCQAGIPYFFPFPHTSELLFVSCRRESDTLVVMRDRELRTKDEHLARLQEQFQLMYEELRSTREALARHQNASWLRTGPDVSSQAVVPLCTSGSPSCLSSNYLLGAWKANPFLEILTRPAIVIQQMCNCRPVRSAGLTCRGDWVWAGPRQLATAADKRPAGQHAEALRPRGSPKCCKAAAK